MTIHKSHFYHKLTRKYVDLFGDMFNNIQIVRYHNDGTEGSRERVPIAYARKERFFTRTEEDPTLQKAISVKIPRMGFEILNFTPDTSRRLNPLRKMRAAKSGGGVAYDYNPVPWDIEFGLYLLVKEQDVASQVMEQILPFFNPDQTITGAMLPAIDIKQDIPVILNGVSNTDTYEGDSQDQRIVQWEFTFTMKAYFYGPVRAGDIIRHTDINIYSDPELTDKTVNVHTDLVSTGSPTIPVDELTPDDPYGYLTVITEYGTSG